MKIQPEPCPFCGRDAHLDNGRSNAAWWAKRAKNLEAELASLQAKLDEVMLKWCPEEMTQEQLDNYELHQRPSGLPKIKL